MRNYFTFAGHDSRDYGVYISGHGTFDAPTRVYELISVPGRSGDLVGAERRLENIELTYPAFVYSDFKNKMAALRGMLLSQIGYQRLEDTYHPDEFRKALYSGGLTVETNGRNDAGEFDLTFICKPQRYLKSGETAQTIASGGSITNPTDFESQPLIVVTGAGQLQIGQTTLTIASGFSSVTIDCEMMDCYSGTQSANDKVTFSGNNFPVLKPGSNGVVFGSGITNVQITPRWWRV